MGQVFPDTPEGIAARAYGWDNSELLLRMLDDAWKEA